MSNIIDLSELFGKKRDENIVRNMFSRLRKLQENALQAIRDNPQQFIEDMRPYYEGLHELVDELRRNGVSLVGMRDGTLPSKMPPSSINVPICDYERWKRMESTLERLKARLGL